MQHHDCVAIRERLSVVIVHGGNRCQGPPRVAPRLDTQRAEQRPSPPVKPPEHMRMVIEASVGQVFGVLADEFGMVTRGRARIAFARQIAMYLSHVACGQSLTDVGRLFARDRTTVAHGCARIEDLRDDPRLDRVLDLLEAIVRYRLTPQGEGATRGVAGGVT